MLSLETHLLNMGCIKNSVCSISIIHGGNIIIDDTLGGRRG